MEKAVKRGELAGKHATVTESANKSEIGISGKITDETRSTITIRTKKGDKRIIKRNATIEICGIRIRGAEIEMAPEERVKIR